MSLTTDKNNKDIHKKKQNGQNKAYLVLSDEEKAKGFVRPVRKSYIHDNCGSQTTMDISIAETYARDPKFYGSTFCAFCVSHFPVSEFKWSDSDQRVGE